MIMREGRTARTSRRRGGRLARLAARLRGGGDLRDRYPCPRPPHSRPRRDARGDLRRRDLGARGARAGRRRALDGGCRLRSRGDAGSRSRSPGTAYVVTDTGIKLSISPSGSGSAVAVHAGPLRQLGGGGARPRSRPDLSGEWSRRPRRGLDYVVESVRGVAARSRWSASASGISCSAARSDSRPPGSSATAARTAGQGPRRAGSTSPPRITASRSRGRMAPRRSMGMNRSAGRPTPGEAEPPPQSHDRPSRASSSRTSLAAHRPVPPGSRPGATRCPLPLRLLPGARRMTTDTASAVEAGHA